MNVVSVPLTPEFEAFIRTKMTTGQYHSESEVLHEGLRLLIEQNDMEALRLEALRKEVKFGFEQLDQGDYLEFNSADEAIAHIHSKGRELHHSPHAMTSIRG